MKRVLVVNVNWLGDVLMTTPVFKALKERFPDSYLGVLAVPRVVDVFKENPAIDDIIVFDEQGAQKTFFGKIAFINYLRRKRFDTVFFIKSSFTRCLICALAGIKSRIGYKRKKVEFLLTESVELPDNIIHRQDRYLYLFKRYTKEITGHRVDITVSDAVKDTIRREILKIKSGYSYVAGINVSANWGLKRWPADKFAVLCDRLARELNCAVVFVGAGKDQLLVNETASLMKEKYFDFCSKTTIKELAALMLFCDIFISNDSGPAHMAAGLNIPTVVLFGPTAKEITAPRGRNVVIIQNNNDCEVPCYNAECADNICMKSIEEGEVFSAVKNLIALRGINRP